MTRSGRHAERLTALGADHVLASGNTPTWPDDVIALTGEGADIALNVAGGDTLTPTIAATKAGGRIHQVGYTADRISPLDIFTAIEHATSIPHRHGRQPRQLRSAGPRDPRTRHPSRHRQGLRTPPSR